MISHVLIFLLKSFRPLLGPASCKFYITCTNYAIMQLQELRFDKACWMILKRLAICNSLVQSNDL